MSLPKETMEIFEALAPELRESEDERIRKEIIHYILYKANGVSEKQEHEWIAYLEKQKEGEKEVSALFDSTDSYNKGFRAGQEKSLQELKEHIKEDKTQCYAYDAGYAAGFIVGKEQGWKEHKAFVKEDSKTADSIPSNCVSDAKCEDRSPKHSDSDGTDIRDTPAYWRGWDDAMKQKEQKPVDYDHEMWKNCEVNFEGGKKEVIEHPEKYGLQKPVEWDELDKDCLNRAIWYIKNPAPSVVKDTNLILWLKSLPGRLNLQPKQEWSEEDIKKIRSEEYTKGFNDAAFGGKLKEWSVEDEDRIRQIERIAQQAGCTQKLQEEIHDWLKSLRSQPKQEWCEEDEKIIGRLRSVVNECAFYKDALDVNGDYCEGDYAKLDAWLKSLRPQSKRDCKDCAMFLNGKCTKPHWKPSEEQMEELQGTITYLAIHNMKVDSLVSLHKDLHKLM